MFISFLYMFRAAMCPSSGELIVAIGYLVYVTVYRLPFGVQVQTCTLARPALSVVWLLFVLFYVVFVCKCVLPPGDNPIAVNKYINKKKKKRT
jgi:hypothetical protein